MLTAQEGGHLAMLEVDKIIVGEARRGSSQTSCLPCPRSSHLVTDDAFVHICFPRVG